MQKYQKYVKQAIQLAGSRKKLSEEVGISKQYIHQIEHGLRVPSLHVALRIQKFSENLILAKDLSPVRCKGIEDVTFFFD